MQKYFNSVTNRSGDAVLGATVTVTTFAGAAAVLYSDNGITVRNAPVTTDISGYFEFYAPDGHYNITISGPTLTTFVLTDVIIEDTLAALLVTAAGLRNELIDDDGVLLVGNAADKRDLAAAGGAGLVGVDDLIAPTYLKTVSDIINGDEVSLFRFIDPLKHAGVRARTNTDNLTQSFTDLIASGARSAFAPAGLYRVIDGKFTFLSGFLLRGEGRESTEIRASGTPTQEIVTRRDWRTEYDAGNFAVASIDAPRAALFTALSRNVKLKDLRIFADYDAATNHISSPGIPLAYPNSGYDIGLLAQYPDCTLDNVQIDGPWSYGGMVVDNTISGTADRIRIYNSHLYGARGLRLEGPHGQFSSGDNYAQMNALDTRGAGGLSDFYMSGGAVYDSYIRLTVDGVERLVQRSASGAALSIDGQNAVNSKKKIQGQVFNGVRFASFDPGCILLNYTGRAEFNNCHTEQTLSAYSTDGITLASGFIGNRSTDNSEGVLFSGGRKSGEPDNLKYRHSTSGLTLVIDDQREDPDAPGTLTNGRMFSADQLRDRGTTAEALSATNLIGSGGGAAVGTFTSAYWKIGNEVTEVIRIILTGVGTLTGNLSVRTRFVNSNIFGAEFDVPNICVSNNVTTGDAGMMALIANGASAALLYKIRSAAGIQNVSLVDLTATSSFWIKLQYMTEGT